MKLARIRRDWKRQANECMSWLPACQGSSRTRIFASADGENVSVVEFESLETLAAWRDHPEHKAVQEWGKREVFAEYRIQVCTPVRDYRFDLNHGCREGMR